MSLKDMEIELGVVNIQRTKIINHPEYFEPVMVVQNGWKKPHTDEITWVKEVIKKASEK